MTIPIEGQAVNPGPSSLRECIARTYGSATWLHQLPGFPDRRETDESDDMGESDDMDVVEDALPVENEYNLGVPDMAGIGLTTEQHHGLHKIKRIIRGLAADRSYELAIWDNITKIDLRLDSTEHISTTEVQDRLRGPSGSSIYITTFDPSGQ